MNKTKSNFIKYLAFCYPYISIILYNCVTGLYQYFFNNELPNDIKQSIFIIINATSLLFGINVIRNYEHKQVNNKYYE
jgi:hypothetical protein